MGNKGSCKTIKQDKESKTYYNTNKNDNDITNGKNSNKVNNNIGNTTNSKTEKKVLTQEEKDKLRDIKEKENIKNDLNNFEYDKNEALNLLLNFTLKNVKDTSEYSIEISEYKNLRMSEFKVIGSTEKLTADPQNNIIRFSTVISIPLLFSQPQPLEINIIGQSKETIKVSLGELICCPRLLYRNKLKSQITLEIESRLENNFEKLIGFNSTIEGNIIGMKLQYEINYLGTQFDPRNSKLYSSNVIEKQDNIENNVYNFEKCSIPLEQFLLDEEENLDSNMLEIVFYDIAHSKLLGKFSGSINKFLNEENEKVPLEGAQNLKVNIKCYKKNFYSFIDYIFKEFNIFTKFAFDFSKSSKTMHFKEDIKTSSLVEELFKNIISVSNPYNGDSSYPMYTFGFDNGKNKDIDSDFYVLNRKEEKPEVSKGCFVKEYSDFISSYQSGNKEINLAKILNKINEQKSNEFQTEEDYSYLNEYNVVIYIISKDINDLNEFIKELIKSSNLPISVVVIGIAKSDYPILENLNKNYLKIKNDEGKTPIRNNFKFISFKECGNNFQVTTKKAYIDIPNQALEYLEIFNISPQN